MAFPIEPPHPSGNGTGGIDPMLAKPLSATQLTADGLPAGDDLIFEPKWDGFRCLVFKDGDEVRLQSRNRRPFERYVPEIVPFLAAQLPDRCVVDGELVVVIDGELAFEALQQRLHPAESRINRLAAETPTSYIAFDLLALGDRDLQREPFIERRARLEQALADVEPPIYLTPATTDRATAIDWFHRFEGAGLDGLIVKPPGDPYTPGKRVQLKVKHKRTADCVVAGYRTHKDGQGVGSLLLGIYDDEGNLHNVGVASSFSAKRRKELVDEIADLRLADDEIEDHPWAEWYRAEAHGPEGSPARMPGAPSRWNAQKDLSWTALRTTRVVEVAYEAMQNGRLRHSARFERWRPDRDPQTCTYDQFEPPDPVTVDEIFA
jgi:ATP-dependent DNA ligase